MEADFSMETFGDFVKNFASGDLEPYIKSEPIPEKQGQVRTAKVFGNLYPSGTLPFECPRAIIWV